ncbi:MAG: membrane protein insertase YidC [Chloroflexi bacterium]|nr:membrane protein insertase YidC [Chloroflexota bacterium]
MLEFIIVPFTNALLFIYNLLGENFGLAIIVFTILVRLATYPITASQLKGTRAMQELQSNKRWQQVQKKYKNDREKLAQEQMKLYKELGINPLGSCLPTLIQFPIIIGLYWSVTRALASTPIQLLNFARDIALPDVASLIPLNSQFLWMDLSLPERLHLDFLPVAIPVLAILVTISSYFQTKMMSPGATDGQSAQMGKMMNIYMPLLMGYISYIYAAGLALYFLSGNLFSMAQYALMRRSSPPSS